MSDKLFDVSAFAYAHRGLWGGIVPENSLAAFKAAHEAGVGIELDVRLTSDGLPVVFHDATLERMCGDTRRLDEIPVEDLAKVRLPDGSHIPTLEDALDAMDGHPVLIELKVDGPGGEKLAETVAALIRNRPGLQGVMSFDEFTVAQLCEIVTDQPVGLLIDREDRLGLEGVFRKAAMARAMGCDYLGPNISSLAAASGSAGGLPLVTWTLRSPSDLQLARKYSAAPIFEGFSADLAKPSKTPI